MSSRLPIIAIPCATYARPHPYPLAHGNNETYIRAVERLGGAPMLIPLLHDDGALRALFAQADGVLFAGGADLDPAHYGEQPHEKLGTVNPLQDAVELKLLGWAREARMPVFAICRGFQLLNVGYGGTLYQDLPSQHPGGHNHLESFDQNIRELQTHAMSLDPGTRLGEWLQSSEIPVNTLHHQAIKDLAPDLKAVGWSDDGLIEAVESVTEPWVVGVQCHPEELVKGADARWEQVFQAFIAAAREWRAQQAVAQP